MRRAERPPHTTLARPRLANNPCCSTLAQMTRHVERSVAARPFLRRAGSKRRLLPVPGGRGRWTCSQKNSGITRPRKQRRTTTALVHSGWTPLGIGTSRLLPRFRFTKENDPTAGLCSGSAEPWVEVSFGPKEVQKKVVNPYYAGTEPAVMRALPLTLLAAILLASCCHQQPPVAAAHADAVTRPPTATEVFHLRSECAALGDRIRSKNIIGIALTQDQVSHYDPKTNRCYVQLTVQTADVSNPNYFATYLYDGQTGEMLATAKMDHGRRAGMVFGVPPPDGTDPNRFWEQATDFMNQRMQDDRKD